MATQLQRQDEARADAAILSLALVRIARFWQLSNAELGRILGLSPASVSRLKGGNYQVEPGTKPFELGQLLVRLFRGLDALVGSDDRAAAYWLRGDNDDLGARPLDLIGSVRGLVETADYVDGYRGRA